MRENHQVEWKSSWSDDYLRWICGFANAEGGVLVIGRNDRGVPVGVSNARKSLEDLPNKIRDVLGIMVDVRLVREVGKELVEIRVEPYPSPILPRGPAARRHCGCSSEGRPKADAWTDRFYATAGRSFSTTWS